MYKLPNLTANVDTHIHTCLCHHATGEMEDYVVTAIDKGLEKMYFLEHLEMGIDYFEVTWLTEQDFDYYFSEGERLKKKYGADIQIGLGVEVGYNPFHREEILKKLTERKWDRIGISYHYYKPKGYSKHLNLVSRKKENVEALAQFDGEALLNTYLDTLKEAVHYLPGDALCHLDAALRFLPDQVYSKENMKKVQLLLKAVKDEGMALEINTSGIAIRNEPFPASHIVSMATELEIPLHLGSDAHSPENVGRYFEMFCCS
jgi:histidinol-phosphatase (PHP family)